MVSTDVISPIWCKYKRGAYITWMEEHNLLVFVFSQPIVVHIF